MFSVGVHHGQEWGGEATSLNTNPAEADGRCWTEPRVLAKRDVDTSTNAPVANDDVTQCIVDGWGRIHVVTDA